MSSNIDFNPSILGSNIPLGNETPSLEASPPARIRQATKNKLIVTFSFSDDLGSDLMSFAKQRIRIFDDVSVYR